MFTTVFLHAFAFLATGAPNAKPSYPIAPPPREKIMYRPGRYRGNVMAVDAESITVCGKERGGPQKENITQRFPAGEALRNGKQEYTERSDCDYRLSDVQVGDRVLIVLHEAGVEDVCVAVRILRRPGGLVPPAPWEDANSPEPHHVHMNALQAHEERGIPLPRRFDPVLRLIPTQAEFDAEERNKKQRAKLRWIENHTAPMPRAVRRSR